MPSVLKMMQTPLSDSDIKKILGDDIKIIIYSDLSKISDLREILTGERDCVVILYEEKQLSGHWTCLARSGDIFTFFDSYGLRPDAELKWLSLDMRRRLNELTPYLTRLLSNESYIYNRTNFQQEDSRIETCGDHVCTFLFCFKYYNMDLEDYQCYMKELKNMVKQPYDYIVAEFVAEQLH